MVLLLKIISLSLVFSFLMGASLPPESPEYFTRQQKRILAELDLEIWNMEGNNQTIPRALRGLRSEASQSGLKRYVIDARERLTKHLESPQDIKKYREELSKQRFYHEFMYEFSKNPRDFKKEDVINAGGDIETTKRILGDIEYGKYRPLVRGEQLEGFLATIKSRRLDLERKLVNIDSSSSPEKEKIKKLKVDLHFEKAREQKLTTLLNLARHNVALTKFLDRASHRLTYGRLVIEMEMVDGLIQSAKNDPALACHLKLSRCPPPPPRSSLSPKRKKCSSNFFKKALCKAERIVHKIGDEIEKGTGIDLDWKDDAEHLVGEAQKIIHKIGDEIEKGTGVDLDWKDDAEHLVGETKEEIQKGIHKTGDVLEVAVQPENLARIALVYCASSVAGPFGSALANAMYDKLILQKDMSDEDLIKSFAIGMAAGYAAEGVSEGVQSAYLSKAASSVTQNMVEDIGSITLNNADYSSKEFLKSLATGLSVVETGEGILAETFESTLQGGLQNTSTQLVEKDFTLKEVNFDRVEQAMYQGMADGLTTASVRAIMDATVIDSLPKRIDKKALEQFTALFSSTMQSIEERQADKFIEDFENLSPQDQEEVLKLAGELGKETRDEVAQQVYEKNFNELTPEEIASQKFTTLYETTVRSNLAGSEKAAEIERYFNDSNGLGRTPAALPLVLVPITSAALTLHDVYTLYAKYEEASEKHGQSFEEFVEQNKTEVGLFVLGTLPAGKLAKVANKVAKATNANKVAKAAKKLAAAGGKGIKIKISEKIKKQMQKRGWTQDSIEEAINNPSTTKSATDRRHLPSGSRNNESATQYYTKDGHYVVRNDKTGDIVQVSNRNDPNWQD